MGVSPPHRCQLTAHGIYTALPATCHSAANPRERISSGSLANFVSDSETVPRMCVSVGIQGVSHAVTMGCASSDFRLWVLLYFPFLSTSIHLYLFN